MRAAAALAVGLLLTALWVAIAVATGDELAPAALLVGAAIGCVMRRSAREGGLGAAVGASLIAVVAIGIGLVLAALGAYSHAQGASFPVALSVLNRSFLPQLWGETGALGGVLGAAGVVVAGVAAPLWDRVDPRRGSTLPASEGGLRRLV
ncbi:MAG: hypothetical protein ABSE52_06585 [Candidatus Dormibacteria bacterium]|jgi:hypothetical protein